MKDFTTKSVTALSPYGKKRIFLKAVLITAAAVSMTACTPGIPADPNPSEYEFRVLLKGEAFTNIVLSGKTNTLIPSFVFYDNGSGGWFKFADIISVPRYYLYEFSDFNSTKIITLYLKSVDGGQALYTRSIWVSCHFGYDTLKVPFVFGLSTLGKGGTNADIEDAGSVTNTALGGEMTFYTNGYYTNTGKIQGYFTNGILVREVKWYEGVPMQINCTVFKFKNYIEK